MRQQARRLALNLNQSSLVTRGFILIISDFVKTFYLSQERLGVMFYYRKNNGLFRTYIYQYSDTAIFQGP